MTIFLIAFAIVWSQRIPIAGDYIDREFARRGVQATYDVKRISFGTQRIENLVIGDPRRPDLTARAVELRLSWSLTGPDISLITARGVLMRGRVVNGKLSLGSVDKLLPPPTGAPFSLPDQAIDVADAAMALDTPAGRLGLAIEGKGNLANGFVGKVAGVSRVLMVGGCAVEKPVFYVTAAISKRRPAVKGPLSAARVLCPKSSIDLTRPRVNVDANFSESVNAWKGNAALDIPVARLDANIVGGLTARVGFDGNPRLTRGDLRFATAQAALGGVRAARLAAAGRYALSIKDNQLSFVGAAEGRGISAVGALQPAIALLSSADGTPLNPIGDGIAAALARAGGAFDAKAGLRLINGTGASIGAGAVRVETLDAVSRSGARLRVSGGDGLTYYWPLGLLRADGNVALSGGGLPTARLSVSQSRGGGPVQGVATIAPMAAGSARLSLTPVRFSATPDGLTAISTVATVDGPFNDGRVLGLVVPVSGRFSSTGGFAFGERCTVVSFRYLEAAGLRLGASRLPMCPTGRALLWKPANGRLQGGAAIDGLRLSGRLGQAPITLASSRVRLIMDKPGFDSRDVAIRLGRTGSVTRFDMTMLSGQFNNKGVRGVFAGGKGKIGNVPLLMSDARGRWSVERGDAVVDGSMLVSDEADPPRFYPLVTNDFHLTLIDGEIDAKGWLDDPQTGTKVTQVTINHVLKTGSGNALLDVPGIRFDENYQPEELTRLTTGVVALVDGVLKGQGVINWTPQGSTSTGVFSTEKMNLAASFGPVTGLTTTIRFSDLLGLQTAPGQIATVDKIQAGIDVFDGEIRYQLLPELKVRVESGRWPFAGGELRLEETILDFSKPTPKKLTFRVIGLDAAAFVQQFEFSNIAATGTFDGVIPMIFDERGGRIVGGYLEARPGGGIISYIGELTDKQLGTYGKLAFDALKSLRYDKLLIRLDGALDGEFLTTIELDGVNRNLAGTSGLLNSLTGIPFEFNISIRGPLRAVLATARSLEDPTGLIQSVLPEALRDQPTTTSVQKEESETVQ